MSNPLYDTNFLVQLYNKKEREIYVRLTALSWQEKPIEYIEGRATGGSINIDGASALRRTCSIALVAQDLNINDFYWGLKNKFKLEVGLKNTVNSEYPDIIWFKQGLYIITSFNVSYTTNNCSVSISGKDKMCLLNGDLAGALPHTTDFGIEEYYDEATNTTTYTSVPIRRIIQESVQNFGNELPQNIIINDLEDAGLELLEYRGDIPLFLFREVNSDSFINMTVNANQICYINGERTTIGDSKKIKYDNLVNLTEGDKPTWVKLSQDEGSATYTIAKFEYGSIPGYRLTDLVFAGDLISNVGETLTSMLDKIKNMLGEFEYFYNLDGKFVFQKKQTYVDVAWNDIEKGDEVYANAAINKSIPIWSFTGNQLLTTIQNTPNILNLRNDFAVWGKKKTTSGTELDIHMRYAIDTKPTRYYSLIDDKWYYAYGDDKVDWRELIYKMALDYRRFYHDDDFISNLIEKNTPDGEPSLFPTGRTGYEQYYVDMEGFWRQLYNPKPQTKKFREVERTELDDTSDTYIKYGLIKCDSESLKKIDSSKVFVIENGILKPFIQGYSYLKPSGDGKYKYSYIDVDGGIYSTENYERNSLKTQNIRDFYVENLVELYDSENNRVIDSTGAPISVYKYSEGTITKDCIRLIDADYQNAISSGAVSLYTFSDDYVSFKDSPEEIQKLYKTATFNKNISYSNYNNFGEAIEDKTNNIQANYYVGYYEFNDNGWAKEVSESPENLLFWFDFLDPESADLAKYSVKAVGVRSKALNDNDVKSIYYREIPKTIFQIGQEAYEHQTGYTYVQLQGTMENLFTISSKGKSAQEKIEELLYQYSYCIESTNLTALPVYHLEPNTRVQVRDQRSNINGEYAVSKITIPLTYNGTMTLTATKVVSNIS